MIIHALLAALFNINYPSKDCKVSLKVVLFCTLEQVELKVQEVSERRQNVPSSAVGIMTRRGASETLA